MMKADDGCADFWIKEMFVELLLHRWPAETAIMHLCYMREFSSQVTETVWMLKQACKYETLS